MTLGFKTEINGKPTHFVEKILACYVEDYKNKGFRPKLHTIRKGGRFKEGTKLHLAINVRARKPKKYHQFNSKIPELQYCISEQRIQIINGYVIIDGDFISDDQIKRLALNDGFDTVDDFWDFFKEDFRGQIIHWTKDRY